MVLLDYTRADVRGRGLGSALFQEVVKVARRERPVGDWLLLELDDDHEGAEDLQRSNRRRIEL
jgi:GNAT superfamily N-acetyltransferase